MCVLINYSSIFSNVLITLTFIPSKIHIERSQHRLKRAKQTLTTNKVIYPTIKGRGRARSCRFWRSPQGSVGRTEGTSPPACERGDLLTTL